MSLCLSLSLYLFIKNFLCGTEEVLHGFVVCNKIIDGALTGPLLEEGIESITAEFGAVTAVGNEIIIVGYEQAISHNIEAGYYGTIHIIQHNPYAFSDVVSLKFVLYAVVALDISTTLY